MGQSVVDANSGCWLCANLSPACLPLARHPAGRGRHGLEERPTTLFLFFRINRTVARMAAFVRVACRERGPRGLPYHGKVKPNPLVQRPVSILLPGPKSIVPKQNQHPSQHPTFGFDFPSASNYSHCFCYCIIVLDPDIHSTSIISTRLYQFASPFAHFLQIQRHQLRISMWGFHQRAAPRLSTTLLAAIYALAFAPFTVVADRNLGSMLETLGLTKFHEVWKVCICVPSLTLARIVD